MSEETQNTETPETAEATPVARLKAEVGYFDGEIKTIAFNQGDNVRTLIDKADINFSDGQSINDDDGESVEPTDQAVGGKTYYIVGNYKQGA